MEFTCDSKNAWIIIFIPGDIEVAVIMIII